MLIHSLLQQVDALTYHVYQADDNRVKSSIENLPNDIVQLIFLFSGSPKIREVCRQWNTLFLGVSPRFINVFKRLVPLPNSIKPILASYEPSPKNTATYKMAAQSYARLLEQRLSVDPNYKLPEKLVSRPFSVETLQYLTDNYEGLRDKRLIEFCLTLPEEIKNELFTADIEGLDDHHKAEELRVRLSTNRRVQQLEDYTLKRNVRIQSLPPEIKYFKKMIRFELSNNPLSIIPPEIGELTQLRSLHLQGTGIYYLPPEITKLSHLLAINLNDTAIKFFPIEVCQLTKLHWLFMRHTAITFLPEEIQNLTNMQKLDFAETDLQSFPAEIGQLENLHIISLKKTPVSLKPEEMRKLPNHPSLRVDV